MQCEHVLVKVVGEASSLVWCIRSVHHLVELLVGHLVVLVARALENHHLLSVFHHQVFLESISFLLMIDLVKVLKENIKRVDLSKVFALCKSSLANKVCFEDFRVKSNAAVIVLAHHCVELP